MKDEPIVIERKFNSSIEEVWKAITDKNEMKKWYFDLKEFKPEVGFEFKFYGGTPENQYLHICIITRVEEERLITYSWRYDGYEGISYVTFELSAEGNQTRIKLTHEGLESFPGNNPDFAKKNFADGWLFIIGTSLKDYLKK